MAKIEGIYLRMYLGFVLLKLNIFKTVQNVACKMRKFKESTKFKMQTFGTLETRHPYLMNSSSVPHFNGSAIGS